MGFEAIGSLSKSQKQDRDSRGAAGGIRTRDHRLSRAVAATSDVCLAVAAYEAGALPLSYGGSLPIIGIHYSPGGFKLFSGVRLHGRVAAAILHPEDCR